MAETLKTIASSTSKLRELLAESKRDLHKIQLLLSALDDGLKSLWPSESPANAAIIHSNFTLDGSRSSAEARLKRDASTVTGTNDEFVSPQLASHESLWKETVNLVASSRVVGIAAQSEEALASANPGLGISQRAWFSDGKEYSRWIGRGAVWMIDPPGQFVQNNSSRDLKGPAAQLIGKGMGIGYRDELVEEVSHLMLFDGQRPIGEYVGLIASLRPWEQSYFVSALINYCGRLLEKKNRSQSKDHVPVSNSKPEIAKPAISAVAALLQAISASVPMVQSQLVEFLSSSPQNTLLSRAAIAALDPSARVEVLTKVWDQFSDVLQIRHTPILSQEANARVLLLSAGYVHRESAKKVLDLARSSTHHNAISERLKNSSERVRWLGMCVGMPISKIVDQEGNQMKFGIEDLETEEARQLRALTSVHDRLGDVRDLQNLFGPKAAEFKPSKNGTADSQNKISKPSTQTQLSRTKIIEIIDASDEEEDDDLKPYAKPDSDEPDSDEDATLVNRDKPKAPVYIRDLISWLSDTENRERHILALEKAGSLIRRKASFGSELHDRIPELALTLVSLQDQFEIDDFHDLKQEALTALVVAEPKVVGPWMVRMLFEGELSISQRVAIIVAIGVGGRELAGFKEESLRHQSQANLERPRNPLEKESTWPTKMLPGNLHDIYSNGANVQFLTASRGLIQKATKSEQGMQRIEALTRKMESTMLDPVSTREWSKPRPQKRLLKNDLSSVVADYFFFPLTRYWQAYSLPSSSRAKNPLNEPSLAALALKTLTLLLLAAGPSAPSLPQTTKELFALLLFLRNYATQHLPVLESLLFALVAILDLHGIGTTSNAGAGTSIAAGARWLAEQCGKEMVEFREWVGSIWERIEKAGSSVFGLNAMRGTNDSERGRDETERCRALTAKALVGINEVVDKYQRLLVGELSRV